MFFWFALWAQTWILHHLRGGSLADPMVSGTSVSPCCCVRGQRFLVISHELGMKAFPASSVLGSKSVLALGSLHTAAVLSFFPQPGAPPPTCSLFESILFYMQASWVSFDPLSLVLTLHQDHQQIPLVLPLMGVFNMVALTLPFTSVGSFFLFLFDTGFCQVPQDVGVPIM